MNGLALATLVVAALAGVATGIRDLRVAQREHYLAGSVSRFAWRWWHARPASIALALVAVVGTAATAPLLWPGLVSGVALVVGPLGLSVRGRTSRLAWTRRLKTLAAATAVLAAVPVVIAGALGGLRAATAATAAVALAWPLVADLALVVVRPLEERLAGGYVRRARDKLARVRPSVVAITGSYGKTSTKGYLAHLLAGRFSVLASPRSYNNRAGLARTVNELLAPGTEVLIAEMGTYGPGEIAALCSWLPPRVAVLTAIGPVHLERFKALERTLEAKAEIAAGAETVVCNVDDEHLAGLADRLSGEGRRVIRASGGSPVGPSVPDVVVAVEEGKLAVEVEGRRLDAVPLAGGAGAGVASNVACALGAALALGASAEELVARLGRLPVAENRLARSVTPSGVVVLDDTYNANPAGTRRALAELERQGAAAARRTAAAARRIVVTPGMVELGPVQRAENAAFAEAAAAVATDLVVVGRTNRRALLEGAARAGDAVVVRVVETRDDAVAWVRGAGQAGDVVLYENDLPDHYP